ncbi:hypothetical protein SAMN02745866_01440 [Alteromonadaceae bacterium Bs31]|nr:hypothetical protein SAMN02745866_01440 [Alteromonadaceae bacterium Bs31]
MSQLFDFHFINDQLMNMGSVNSASELQGLLCGRLCTGEALDEAAWQKVALSFMDLDFVEANEQQQDLLKLMLNSTRELLQDDQYQFEPLLPDDNSSLERRTQELGSWCEGFLHGLGQAIGQSNIGKRDELPEDVTDALKDLARISQVVVEAEADMDLDENEAYWIELVEYVKVAVLTIYTEFRNKTEPQQTKVVH